MNPYKNHVQSSFGQIFMPEHGPKKKNSTSKFGASFHIEITLASSIFRYQYTVQTFFFQRVS